MQDKKTDFVVDGQFDDIVYELKKEINKGYQEDESKVFDALGDTKLQICASIAAELIIRIEENEKDKEQYKRGFITPNKRYYLKIDRSLLKSVLQAAASLLLLAEAIENPANLILKKLAATASGASSVMTFCEILKAIPKEHFCVFLAAHQEKTKNLISVESISDCLHGSACPFEQIYYSVYGQYCECQDMQRRCLLSNKSIVSSMRSLGKPFGINEITPNHVFEVK